MLNEHHRKNIHFDKPFIKSLIIGICTGKTIREGGGVNQDLSKFIRELFSVRVEGNDDDGTRYMAFDNLVHLSCDEIRENNF